MYGKMLPAVLLLAAAVASVGAQNATSGGTSMTGSSASSATTPSSTLASTSASSAAASSSTSSGNATTTTLGFSIEDMWNMFVGPVSTANITTTMAATPVPSSSLIPPPPLYYAAFPPGAEVPAVVKNSSWKFPKDFSWGFASAAYQIEGAVADEGRGPSVWDVLTHRVTNWVVTNQTGDVVDNGYYMYKLDIARMAAMGVKSYSFSISWSRILPYGRGPVNEQGLAHYDDVINTCLHYGITPYVTLYHNLYGGWTSSEVVDDFANYAKIVFQRYGNKVPNWVTLNEPNIYCNALPYPDGYFKDNGVSEEYQTHFCGYYGMLAHSKVYHMARQMGINGTISVKVFGGYKVPKYNTSDDLLAVQRAWDWTEGWFFHPLFIDGDWPATLKPFVSKFLPPFTSAQKAAIVNTSDIMMYDSYTSEYRWAPDSGVAACVNDRNNPNWPYCFQTGFTASDANGGWNIGYAADPGSPAMHNTADWLPALMRYARDTWKPKKIILSEFGFSEPFEGLKQLKGDLLYDQSRMRYFHDYTRAILLSLSEGINIVGCLAWSFMDNFEWQKGFDQTRYGMQYVNFSSPTLDRTYKASFFEYVKVFQQYQEK